LKSKYIKGLATVMLLMYSVKMNAQNSNFNLGKYSNEFLSIGVDARGRAMGGAVAASTSDVFSSYWNAAGLANYEGKFQVGVMHENRYNGIASNDFIGFTKTFSQRYAFALTANRLSIQNIPNTFNLVNNDGSLNYDNVTPFSANDHAFFLSFAKRNKKNNLTLGLSSKVIYRNVGTFAKAWGFGLDAGMQYRTKHFLLGLSVHDISSTFNSWQFTFTEDQKRILGVTGNTVPKQSTEITLPKTTAAFAYKAASKTFNFLIETNFDISHDGKRNTVLLSTNEINIEPKLGIEIGYKNVFKIRGGLNNFQNITDDLTNKKNVIYQPSIGAGLKIKSFSIEYAFTDFGNSEFLPYSNVFALKVDFNGRKSSNLPPKVSEPQNRKDKEQKSNKIQTLPKIYLEQIN